MINLRETEIRNESLELVVETYRIANLITDQGKYEIRMKLIDAAFMVSSSIAKAFIALQDDQFESDMAQALRGIDSIWGYLEEIVAESLLDDTEVQPLRDILDSEGRELLQLLSTSQINNSYAFTPKLEKVCI